ncbi:hypothetical protein OZX57_08365 [Bifidobacterium sp. ESL0682]|uniref:hypothetical protein n=1 Tax=Bifidobacterium sp. ESL0682 TaxID=2983212 RepID=UPI0023F75910|nr:hypothetical protein [Bifidobacterium sp. ESL0682]WEV41935.1 hypothetical protein OZX57_08365 [Bifidobacterium sp. ESL0682]
MIVRKGKESPLLTDMVSPEEYGLQPPVVPPSLQVFQPANRDVGLFAVRTLGCGTVSVAAELVVSTVTGTKFVVP